MAEGFVKAVDQGLIGQILNFAVDKAFGIPAAVNKGLDICAVVHDYAVAGASGIMGGISNKASGFSMSAPECAAAPSRLAEPVIEKAVSMYHCDHNDIVCPATPNFGSGGTGINI
jgi:hypothetical protein